MAVERALELDAERVAPKGALQPAHRRLVAHAMTRASTEADEAGGVGLEIVETDRRRAEDPPTGMVARVRVRARQEPAEVGPATGVANEQRDVATVVKRHLRSVDRPQARRAGGLGELHGPRNGVVVGQRKRLVAPRERDGDELLGQARPVQEREGRMAMELDVRHEQMFASGPDGPLHRAAHPLGSWRRRRRGASPWLVTTSPPDPRSR